MSGGYISATTINGNAPYSYNWNNGTSSALNNAIAAGNYQLMVNDLNGCTVTMDDVVTQPASPLIVETDKDVDELFFGDKVPVAISTNYNSVNFSFSPYNFLS